MKYFLWDILLHLFAASYRSIFLSRLDNKRWLDDTLAAAFFLFNKQTR